MRLLRIISLTLSIALITSVCFVNADEGYIDGNKIVINGITYENKESAFSKIKTTSVGHTDFQTGQQIDLYEDYQEYQTYPSEVDNNIKDNPFSNADGKTVIPEIGSTDGKSITPKILCTTPSSEDCVSVWYLTTEAIGEPVRGSFYEQVPLWQKLSYDGKVYYTPVDGLDYGEAVIEQNEDVSSSEVNNSGKVYSYNNATKEKEKEVSLNQVDNYSGVEYSSPIDSPEGYQSNGKEDVGIFKGIWIKTKGAYDTSVNWATHPKRIKGFRLLGEGLLEGAKGATQMTAGTACVASGYAAGGVGGIVTTALCGGTVGLGANNLLKSGSKIGSALDNIFSTDDDIRDGSFDAIRKSINATTEEGSIANIALHGMYITTDTVSTMYSVKSLANIRNVVSIKAGTDISIGIGGQAFEDITIGKMSSPAVYFGVGVGSGAGSYMSSYGVPSMISKPIGGLAQEGVKDIFGEDVEYMRVATQEAILSFMPSPNSGILESIAEEAYGTITEIGVHVIKESKLLESTPNVSINGQSSFNNTPTCSIGGENNIELKDLNLNMDYVNALLNSYK